MIFPRPAAARGHMQHGWLDTYHTFSFAGYHDPDHMGFHSLRVINEDWIAPGRGFGTHPHDNMEIITCVLEGALRHQDNMGQSSVIRPGDWQHMSAGTGITHSEYNASDTESVHLYQIWILPHRNGLEPTYSQQHITEAGKLNRLRLVASGDGRQNSLKIQTDTDLYVTLLEPGASVTHEIRAGRGAWIQILRGSVSLNDLPLKTGDGAAVKESMSLNIAAESEAELILFDL